MNRFCVPDTHRDFVTGRPNSLFERSAMDSKLRLFSDIIDQLNFNDFIDNSKIESSPSYDPRLLFKGMVYAYSDGARSSRQLAERFSKFIDFIFICKMIKPDFRTIMRFRDSNLDAIAALYAETAILCMEEGYELFDTATDTALELELRGSDESAADSTKVDRFIVMLDAAIAGILKEARDIDDRDDEKFGDSSDNTLPECLTTHEKRVEAIRNTKNSLKKRKPKR